MLNKYSNQVDVDIIFAVGLELQGVDKCKPEVKCKPEIGSLISETYERQHRQQNSTQDVSPVIEIEALYVEQFRKMFNEKEIWRRVPASLTNRFDVGVGFREYEKLQELTAKHRVRGLSQLLDAGKSRGMTMSRPVHNDLSVCIRCFNARQMRRLESSVGRRYFESFASLLLALRTSFLYWKQYVLRVAV